jgi:PleD family two-component response regulator
MDHLQGPDSVKKRDDNDSGDGGSKMTSDKHSKQSVDDHRRSSKQLKGSSSKSLLRALANEKFYAGKERNMKKKKKKEEEEEEEEEEDDDEKSEEKDTYSAIRVLLVEDTPSIVKVLLRFLQRQGCEVTVAKNGLIGLELLKSRQFDICLMDFIMVSTLTFYICTCSTYLNNCIHR